MREMNFRNLFIEPADRRSNHGEKKSAALVRRTSLSPFPLAVLFTTLKLILFAVIVVGFLALGLGIGVMKAYVETTPSLDIAQLTISDRTSFLYDKDGNLISSIADVEYRDWVDIEDVPDLLKNAFIAVEDVRFYKHSGVDFKRLFSAALEILGNSNSSGGSTITQQLIKNKILGTQRNYKRKIQEAYLALELEKQLDKDSILEAYLNDIYLGQSNYGIKTAAMDYFGKELDELTVRECAMLAGLPQQPYSYDPRRNKYVKNRMEVTDKRTDHVLDCMYQAGFISAGEYNAALGEEVRIIEVSKQKQMYDDAYFVEYAINDVVAHLLSQRGLSDTAANRSEVENELRTGGYRIYTTLDPNAQEVVQTTLSTWEKYPTLADPSKDTITETNADGAVISQTVQPQAASVVLDFHTGELRAVIGGRYEPTIRRGLNRASQSYTEVGSSIKPLSVYGPALDLGYAPSDVVANMDGAIDGWGTEKGYPGGGLNSHYGPVTLRRGVVSSLNVAAAHVLMDLVTPQVGAEYLLQLGISADEINVDGPGLALGTSGITPVQMAAAYGCIANGGVYLEPLSFTKVLDENGNVVLDAEAVRETRRVFKETTAYLLVDMMQDAVKSGTGTRAKIEGMTVAGKTGTNSDYASVYFAGMTPYYVSTVFVGHDYPANKLKSGASGGDYAAPLWQAYMEVLSEGQEDRAIIDVDPSAIGLVKQTVCSVSGKLATDACRADRNHKVTSDWFTADNMPTEYCDMHVAVSLCRDSGELATQFCPADAVEETCIVLVDPSSQFYRYSDDVLFKGIPNAVRTELGADAYASEMTACHIHADGTLNIFGIRTGSEELIAEVRTYLASIDTLDEYSRTVLSEDIATLELYLTGYEYSTIEPAYNKLKLDYETIRAQYPSD